MFIKIEMSSRTKSTSHICFLNAHNVPSDKIQRQIREMNVEQIMSGLMVRRWV